MRPTAAMLRRAPRSCSPGSLLDQSPLSITIFALVFGATFLVTAPLTVVFVRENFGTKNSARSPA